MKGRLKWLAPLVIGVALVGTACSSDDSGDEASTEEGGETAAAEYTLVTEGTLTICSDAPYEPFEMEIDGKWTGFDMDLINAVAGGMGLETSVTVVPFDGIWLLPAAGECDIVVSAMTITEERAESALFTDAYFDADQSLLVRADQAEEFATLESLGGKNIAVQTGTTGETYAQEHQPEGATLISFDEPAAMFLALEAGDVDAILQDLPVNGYRSTQDDSMVVTETFATGEQYGFAVDPDNAGLAEAVNAQLAALRESGSYDEIHAKWFGEGAGE
ncbi:MAG: transporter substrate-binding domain-containing protein [Dehalococcoidia bacterium]